MSLMALRIGELFSDQDFSIVDRTSWAVMERYGIEEAVAFDVDFGVYRYGPGLREPSPSIAEGSHHPSGVLLRYLHPIDAGDEALGGLGEDFLLVE